MGPRERPVEKPCWKYWLIWSTILHHHCTGTVGVQKIAPKWPRLDSRYLLTAFVWSGCPVGCGRRTYSCWGGSCWHYNGECWAVRRRWWSGRLSHWWVLCGRRSTTPQLWVTPRWHSGYWPLFCLQSQLWFSQLVETWLDYLVERTSIAHHMYTSNRSLWIQDLRAVMSHLLFSTGWSAMQVTGFPSRVFTAVTFRLKIAAPLLELLKTGKESCAWGLPANHWQWYCNSVLFTDCTEHTGVPNGLSVEKDLGSNFITWWKLN